MNKSLIFLTCLITIGAGSVASATWIPLTGDPVPLSSLPEGTLIVGDKHFFEFDLLGSATGGAIAPDMNSVFIQGGMDDVTGDYGLRFLLALNTASGQSANATLSFTVAIPGNMKLVLPGQDYLFKNVSMVLTGISATGTGVVNVSETVFDAPTPTGQILAQLICYKQEGSAVLKDYAEFDPATMIWVHKKISVSGGTGPSSAAHISEFFQFYSQIPEPATIALLGLGALALLPRHEHKKVKILTRISFWL